MAGKRMRIVQPQQSGGATPTQGTKVMVGDSELSGVYRIVLTAEVNDVWRAEIHCFPQVHGLEATGNVTVRHQGLIARMWHGLRRLWGGRRGQGGHVGS